MEKHLTFATRISTLFYGFTMMHQLAIVVALCLPFSYGYYVPYFQTRRSVISMKRGRGSFQKEIGGGANSPQRGGGGDINWCPIPAGNKLPEQEGKVSFINTELPTLKNSATNPTGAVSVLKYKGETFCFDSSCPSCKIPLTKAKVFDPNEESGKAPRLLCDFCKATYNLKTGEKLQESAEKAGLFGGVVKNIFAAQESAPLNVYKLGEKGGKLLIALD